MESIKKYLKGKYSRRDYYSVLKGFESGENDKDFYGQLEKQWDETDLSQSSDFNKNRAWTNIKQQLFVQDYEFRPVFNIYRFVRNTAAILFVPLLLVTGILYFQSKKTVDSNAWAEISCPSGVRTEFHLPDGSTGFLNSKSKLKYPVEFGKTRNVYLEGEAFFNVVKKNGKKFSVNTPSLKVEVLGTSFNVSAYSDSRDEVITLQTGKVNIFGKNDETLSGLVPGQQFTLYKKGNKFLLKDVKAQNYSSWISGKMIIQDEAFEEVAKRLSRWYDVDIELEGQKLKDFKYYATFESEPLDEVLRLITITAPIQYQEMGRTKAPDGSFTKRKIKFKLDGNRLKNFN
ncbi:MAG: hypothetical protein A2W90_07295 [Bacteroidetes bacterium GWF2_42_66]|nr:MAG: hypothetical protein A2W92_07285 [Bacteroidetes bacterium GWA2_42_15]OFX96896.1 MAG: hypothetical protein A2W89_19995 [Bacteroidetes bacterium GWE2_42_39]OFY44653.1 MAG: hypothetical protein A2W90_07295 [Bacteroidetes bacterium GWF2_42_66]HAZ01618.1 hypothetical protein [Marinilabiliales bacterium]HBL75062.1 hypothetical protein [Prolixibacteraceae bacterium]